MERCVSSSAQIDDYSLLCPIVQYWQWQHCLMSMAGMSSIGDWMAIYTPFPIRPLSAFADNIIELIIKRQQYYRTQLNSNSKQFIMYFVFPSFSTKAFTTKSTEFSIKIRKRMQSKESMKYSMNTLTAIPTKRILWIRTQNMNQINWRFNKFWRFSKSIENSSNANKFAEN